MTSILIMCIVAIVLVVVLGAKTKSNIGLWAMAAAYILGAFILKMKVSDIINMWPTKIFILLFSVTFFYGFAILNKTLEKVSMQVVYRFRKMPWAIPFILYMLGLVIAGIGAGDAANAMLIPIAMSIAAVAGMHPFLGGISVLAGVGTGGFSPISVIGIFIRGLMEQVGKYPPEEANVYANHALLHAFVLFMIILLVAYVVFKGHKIKSPVMDKPEPLDKKQKITLWIIAGFVVLLLVPPILKTIFPPPSDQIHHGNINVAFIASTLHCRHRQKSVTRRPRSPAYHGQRSRTLGMACLYHHDCVGSRQSPL
jgi:di/tricarboxylate transporter